MFRIGSIGSGLLTVCLACQAVAPAASPQDTPRTVNHRSDEKANSPLKLPKTSLDSASRRLTYDDASTLDFSPLDPLIRNAIARKKLPGCVIAIGRRNRILLLRAYGNRALLPEPVSMDVDTVFDLASLTKSVATATSIMILVEKGQIDLDSPVAAYLPRFATKGKANVTVRQVMIHSAGLPKVNPLRDYEDGYETAVTRLLESGTIYKPGTEYLYSDIGYLVLGELVRRVSGLSLDVFSDRYIFSKLKMNDTRFNLPERLKRRAAPTEQRDDEWIVGVVHDPRAYRLGGVAGNAGLFSTASDLSRFAQMMLNEGRLENARVFSRSTVQVMTEPHFVDHTIRALGWDIRSAYSINRGALLSARAYGHGGFTGTALWIDPILDLFVIFLSNRVHPDGSGNVNRLAGAVANIAVRALSTERMPSRPDAFSVKTGIDVLQEQNFESLRGKRVGLITNATGQNREGVSTVDLLRQADGIKLVALFAPEHGLYADQEGPLEDDRESDLKLPIYSLFGKNRRPTESMLEGIDTLVFDIQDVGTRFFTYMSTLHQVLLAAADLDKSVVVLDRPNPINGKNVEGPMPDPWVKTFVNYFPLPVRHGMTVGELARLINSQESIHAQLEVVKMKGWNRDAYYDQTGLPWVNPSPNIRSPTQALLYPALGLLESTNLSVGRGTDSPFEVFGAPWLNPTELTAALRQAGLPGVTFTPVRFTPQASKYRGQSCPGIRVAVIDRDAFLPVRTAFEIAHALLKLHKGKWTVSELDKLVAKQRAVNALISGLRPYEIEKIWEADLLRFYERRAAFLLYPRYSKSPR